MVFGVVEERYPSTYARSTLQVARKQPADVSASHQNKGKDDFTILTA